MSLKLKIGFRAKLVIILTVFLFVMVGSLLAYLNSYLSNYLKVSSIDNFKIIAESGEGSYFAFTEAMKVRTIDWSSDGRIRGATAAILKAKTAKEKEMMVRDLGVYLRDEKMKYDPSIVIVDILDKDGIVIASSRAERVGINEKEEEAEFGAHRFSEAIGSGFGQAFVTSSIYEPDEHMAPMIHSVARIFSVNIGENDKLLPLDAVLLIHFDKIDELTRTLGGAQQVIQGAKTGLALFETYKSADIFLVNGSRNMITRPRFDSFDQEQKIASLPVTACFDENREVAQDYVNHRGMHVFGASMCMGRDNLVLIVEVASDEIYGTIGLLQRTLLIGGLFVLIFGSLGLLFFVGQFLKKLINITQVAEEVAKGNMKVRSVSSSASSTDEIDNLATTFNSMLDNIERSQESLERVNAEIRKKENVLAQKVDELERFKDLTVGRELQMVELKKQLMVRPSSPDQSQTIPPARP